MMTSKTPTTGEIVRLNELPPRLCGIVRVVETDDEETARLKMLGVCPGRRVEVIRSGDPLILKIFGTRLGLAGSLASRVRVEICAPENCSLHEQPTLISQPWSSL
jgi:Fe2+ transport system protein FeoA